MAGDEVPKAAPETTSAAPAEVANVAGQVLDAQIAAAQAAMAVAEIKKKVKKKVQKRVKAARKRARKEAIEAGLAATPAELRQGIATLAAGAVAVTGVGLAVGPTSTAAAHETMDQNRSPGLSRSEGREDLEAQAGVRQGEMTSQANQIQQEAERLVSLGVFFWPTAGQIGSPFGMRLHPILHRYRMHNGVDIGAPCGQPIYAVADGTVTKAASGRASGNHVRIDHGLLNGAHVETDSMHMTKYVVANGERVTRGQVIGYVGSTGLSTECHLHFSTYENGKGVDPAKYLKP